MRFCISLLKILLVAFISLAATTIYLQIPRYNGRVTMKRSGHNDIFINRNSFGIPVIKSETFNDVAYGIGYAHAQDRLWSMQFKRRITQGRISEIAGRETIRTDLLFRQLKLDATAKIKYSKLPDHVKAALSSYSDGINDYVNSLTVLPLEFLLVGDKFEPWLPHDCVGLINLISVFLTLEIVYEPSRQLLYEKYGEEMLHKFFALRSEYNYEQTTVMNDEDLIKMGLFQNKTEQAIEDDPALQIGEQLIKSVIEDGIVEMLDDVVKGIQGSNSWAVHGNHTVTGKPLLANDPHLETMIPTMWYQTELAWKTNGTTTRIKGASLPGLPFIMIGRTDYMAWGITNNIVDNSDFYLETISNHTYLYDGKWLPLKETNETIKIRSEEDYHFVLQETHHGPVIAGLIHLLDPKNYQLMKHVVSLRWTAMDEDDQSMLGLYNLMFSKNVDDIENHFNQVVTTNLNLIYATVDNHIGYYAQGKLPVKNSPHHHHFLNGSDPKNDWIRYYTKEEQPRVRDPAKGYLVSANNKIATDNLIHNINIAQSSIPRARRISDLLQSAISSGKKISSQDFLEMQKDVLDVYASYIVAPLLKIYDKLAPNYFTQQEISQFQRYIDQLRGWDFKLTKESTGASIYIAWEHFYLRTYFHELGDQNLRIVINMSYMFDHFFMKSIEAMADSIEKNEDFEKQTYCKIEKINESGDCVQNLFDSFRNAFHLLINKLGKEHLNWKWGKLHKHRFDHKPFSGTLLKYFYERSYIGEGDRRTINVGGVNHLPDNWDSWYSPNYRQVIDLSEANDSYYVVDTGVNESPFSSHYDDQMKLHEHGKTISMKFESENEKSVHSLKITFQNKKK